MNNLKIIFMGTPEFGLKSLEALYNAYNVIGVVCKEDKPGNRGEVIFSPIKKFAVEHNIKVFQPVNLKNEFANIMQEEPDLIITCAYGQMIPQDLLDFPKYGCINIHASLLPKLRGGAPIHRAIIDGYDKTGITIMEMVYKMDAGDILYQEEIPILESDNAGTLHDKLSILASKMIIKILPDIINNKVIPRKQNEEEVTFGWNIKKEDEMIDYTKTSREIVNQIRGLNPWPGAYSILTGKIVKIWKAKVGNSFSDEAIIGQVIALYNDGIGVKTGNGEIIITELQLEGRKKMLASEFINGAVNKELLVGRIFE